MNRSHWLHLIFGTLTGLGIWAVATNDLAFLPASFQPAVLVALGALGGVALALLGEFGPVRALKGAAAIAATASGLVYWAGLEFGDPARVMEAEANFLALLVVCTMPVPFIMSLMRFGSAGLHDYPDLFVDAWTLVVRFAAAGLFAGISLGVLFILGQLLEIVSLSFLSELLRHDPVVAAVYGAAFGLGLAVVYDFAEMISPVLVLRLLRLLVLPVVLVVAVFVIAVLLRPMDQVFIGFSTGGVLIATGFGVLSLVSIALDQDDHHAVQGGMMQSAAKALALFLPILGGLALYAFVLRVVQYGWTPVRVSGCLGAFVVLAYGQAYAWAVLRGRGWMERIRQSNLLIALAIVAISVVWLTPFVSPEKIAARSQLERFAAGQVTVNELPLAAMKFEWGAAGDAALQDLRQMNIPELSARLAALDEARNRWDFSRAENVGGGDLRHRPASWTASLEVFPASADLPEGLLDQLWTFAPPDTRHMERCRQGETGACVVFMADLLPDSAGTEALFFLDAPYPLRVAGAVYGRSDDGSWALVEGAGGALLAQGDELARALRAGDVTVTPLEVRAISFGGAVLPVLPAMNVGK